MPDPRDQDRIYYPRETLLWSALMMFLLGLRSRRQFRFESRTRSFVANLNRLSGSNVQTAPHDDTIAYYLQRMDPGSLERLPGVIVRRLVRMKALDRWRVRGHFLVAVDGTGQLTFRRRHCPSCLTRTASNGQIVYFHQVLEAKLVTANGLAFSLATEFIENVDPSSDKQDCELKAFARLAAKLKSNFPQLPMILLGDALYANGAVFTICRENQWRYIFTFKRGRNPELFSEFEKLKTLSPENRTEHRDDTVRQRFRWVNDLNHGGHRLHAFDCREDSPSRRQYFAWLTDIAVGRQSVITLANQGGRCRWKIENEGFNTQKNHGYELEHAYGEHPWAAKNFYFLLQAAHAINQLMIKGSLIGNFKKTLGSVRNFLRRLAEALRNTTIDPTLLDPDTPHAIQIRLDSS